MAEEPGPEEEVVLASMPQIISPESISGAGAGVTPTRGASAAGAELGRRLLLAARAGDAQAVLDLMAQGAPFTTDWLGTSPLHLAAAGGHAGAAGVLLRAGVSRDARTKVERTPLHLAAHAGHVRLAALLLDHGAMLDCRDMLRMTPLHWACARGHAALAGLLARRGADARARCKFRRTPLQLAAKHPATLRALRDALRDRAAADSVKAIQEEMAVDDANAVEQKQFQPVQMQIPLEEKANNIKILPKMVKPNLENESRPAERGGAGAGAGAGPGGAAALLRQHGIALLPADDGGTVLSALQSGRTVVLSDAGKLMLKESSSPPASPLAGAGGAGAGGAGAGGAGAGARGVVLRATPARSPPRPGVKVFTVNKLAPAPALVRKVITPHEINNTQIKYVQLPSDATVLSPTKTPMKAKTKLAGPGAGAGAGGRPGVKIIMNKASFSKLIATAARAHDSGDNEPLTGLTGGGEAVVCVPEQFVRSMSARYLRAQLLAAHAALAALSRELRAARAPRS